MFKKFLNWLIISSANPEEYSMTVKGLLLQYLGFIMTLMTLIHVPVGREMVIQTIDQVVIFLGAFLSVFGIIRKAYYAIKG